MRPGRPPGRTTGSGRLCQSVVMDRDVRAPDLLREIGLVADGPVLWGRTAASRQPGIFVVERAAPCDAAPLDAAALRRWLERVPGLRLDGERPTAAALAGRLASFWLPGQTVLYAGRSQKALGSRVAALYATPLGHRRPHAGGHWLKTLADLSELRLWWAETDAPEEYEDALLEAFVTAVGASLGPSPSGGQADLLPWAVPGSVSLGQRRTGITDHLVEGSPSGEGSTAAAVHRGVGETRRRTTSTARRGSTGRSAAESARAAAVAPRPVETHLTASGLATLQAELARLVGEERPGVIERVKHARELGDLRENADYEAARNEQSFLEGRIRDLETRIRTAVLIEAGESDRVVLGSAVRVEHEGTESLLVIVGSTESDPQQGRISQASPVGKALLGRRPGDIVEVRTPSHQLRYRVVAVARSDRDHSGRP